MNASGPTRASLSEIQKQHRYQYKNSIKQSKQRYYFKNKENIKNNCRQYYILNKDDIKWKQKLYRVSHKEKISLERARKRDSLKLYYLQNKDILKMKQKQYYLENKEAIQRSQKQYKLDNQEALKQYRLNNKEAIRRNHLKYRLKSQNTTKLTRKPRKCKVWSDPGSVRLFFNEASRQLCVREPMDWYRVSRIQMNEVGGSSLYSIFGNLGKALQFAFPGVDWDLPKFSFKGKKSRQRWLRVVLQQILPEDTLILEDYLHPDLFWDSTNYKMELDIWIPKYKIALEYQGEHHYRDLCDAYGPTGTHSLYSFRDMQKKELCSKHHITLVTVPYWWDGKKESLCSTLFQIRPDVFPKTLFPQIPTSPQVIKRDGKDNHILNFLMHGEVWNMEDPTGWFISEKLDGFRAFWDGSKLFSKNGNLFPVPLEFTHFFPRGVSLDGELWTGYNDFYNLSTILRKTTFQNSGKVWELWKDVKFCVFDAPKYPGHYFERHSFAMNSIRLSPNICVIPIAPCLGRTHLQTILNEIAQKKGEGIMLYHPSAKYTPGRTSNLLKVKAFSEEDVKFIKINPNSYSFLCEQKNGVECIVKCSGWDYSFPPPSETILTVKHSGYFESSRKMRYPFLFRVRNLTG